MKRQQKQKDKGQRHRNRQQQRLRHSQGPQNDAIEEVKEAPSMINTAVAKGDNDLSSSSSSDDDNPLMAAMSKKAKKESKKAKLDQVKQAEITAQFSHQNNQLPSQNLLLIKAQRRMLQPRGAQAATNRALHYEDSLSKLSTRLTFQSTLKLCQLVTMASTVQVYPVQNRDLNRLVLLQSDCVIQMDLAKKLSDFQELSEVRQLAGSMAPPQTTYCLPEKVHLMGQGDRQWVDMINTFYHVGQKQVCELHQSYNPIDQTLQGLSATPIVAQESGENLIESTHQAKQGTQKLFTVSSIGQIGREATENSIQVIKQTLERKLGETDVTLTMEITNLEHPTVTSTDVLITNDRMINLEKRTQPRHRKAYPLFNHQFVAIYDSSTDAISVMKVVEDHSQGSSNWWSKLSDGGMFLIQSSFAKQVRMVTSGRPLLYCNGTLHMMQLLVCYANNFIELVEVFPPASAGASPVLERQFIYAYAEPHRFYPEDERQNRVQVFSLPEQNHAFFAMLRTEEPSDFQVFDLQSKVIVHTLSLSQVQKDFQKAQGVTPEPAFSLIYYVSQSASQIECTEPQAQKVSLYPTKPLILAVF